MTAFFICIILIGIFIVCIALIWMVIERKNARDYRLDLDERRFELQQVIEDADQLLGELNQFSDYIVNRMEEKQNDMEFVIKNIDERLDLFDQIKGSANAFPDARANKPAVSENTEIEKEVLLEFVPISKGKIIPFDVKKREVENLRKTGMDSTEIAKLLNMGKGEIELISRMSK